MIDPLEELARELRRHVDSPYVQIEEYSETMVRVYAIKKLWGKEKFEKLTEIYKRHRVPFKTIPQHIMNNANLIVPAGWCSKTLEDAVDLVEDLDHFLDGIPRKIPR